MHTQFDTNATFYYQLHNYFTVTLLGYAQNSSFGDGCSEIHADDLSLAQPMMSKI